MKRPHLVGLHPFQITPQQARVPLHCPITTTDPDHLQSPLRKATGRQVCKLNLQMQKVEIEIDFAPASLLALVLDGSSTPMINSFLNDSHRNWMMS